MTSGAASATTALPNETTALRSPDHTGRPPGPAGPAHPVPTRPAQGHIWEAYVSADMTPDEFRTAGHALIDWVADLRTRMATLPVMAQVHPGEIRRALPDHPPTEPDGFAALMADLDSIVLPGTTHVQHPSYFGWFPANQSLASILGDVASGGIGALGITWLSNPALTEVEEVMCDWLRQLVGLSDAWRGSIHDTASTAALVALICAREKVSEQSFSAGGLQNVECPLVVYCTEQSHSSILKATTLAGFGRENLRIVGHDARTFAMDVNALSHTIAEDLAVGRRPACVVANVGSTGTTAIDPVAEIVQVAQKHGAWVHVDAAMAGTAMLLPEYRHLWEGVEGADSISWNPHKWMGVALDCSQFLVRDSQHLIRCMASNPSYLRTDLDDEVTSYKDWGIPLGRRFRALKIWFQLRIDGVPAIQARVRRDLDNARWLAAAIRDQAPQGWEVLNPVVLQTVCVRHTPSHLRADEASNYQAIDEHTLAWAAEINDSGKAFVTPALLDGRWMVRFSIGAEPTEREHVASLWKLARASAEG